jgi:hypothetical protein
MKGVDTMKNFTVEELLEEIKHVDEKVYQKVRLPILMNDNGITDKILKNFKLIDTYILIEGAREYYGEDKLADKFLEYAANNDYRIWEDAYTLAREYVRDQMDTNTFDLVEGYMNFEELGCDLVNNWDVVELGSGPVIEFFG